MWNQLHVIEKNKTKFSTDVNRTGHFYCSLPSYLDSSEGKSLQRPRTSGGDRLDLAAGYAYIAYWVHPDFCEDLERILKELSKESVIMKQATGQSSPENTFWMRRRKMKSLFYTAPTYQDY